MREAAVRYRLSMASPHTHLFRVEVWSRAASGGVELVMPSWTPGSYLMREFPRNVQDFEATDETGAPLRWRKIDKNRWLVTAPAGTGVRASYRVYANELSVRTSHLDASHAFVNGTSVFMYPSGLEREPLTVRVDAPAGWRVTTTLESGKAGGLRAEGYDRLADTPMEIGTHELLAWEQDGIAHQYAIWGRGEFDRERLVADTRRIIDAAGEIFGGLPYERYLFIVHLLPEGRGGLEHADSCVLQADRWGLAGEGYESFLALVAHEFFHVWNVKRIRPEPLGPFDYTRENYTRNLFVAEGLTTYYTDLLLRRAGLMTPERYLVRLGEAIARLQALPGRHHQTLEESSFDAWIKLYRPNEHTPNAQISYYHKGALVGLLLDMEIRRATGGERSLDDLMRLLWERYGSRDVGFPEDIREGIQALAQEVAGESLERFFDAYVRGTEELDYDGYLATVGLRLGWPREVAGVPAARPSDAEVREARLGARTREEGGRLRITHVLEGTPAHEAGVNAGDELVAVDGVRATASELSRRLRGGREVMELAVFRRDELLSLCVPLAAHPEPAPRLVRRADAEEAERAALEAWLGAGASLDRVPEGR